MAALRQRHLTSDIKFDPTMSTRRSSALAQKSPINESENEDVDMKDRPDNSQSAADIDDEEDDEDGSRGLLRMIGDVSSHLCELEEE